jgi:hypothetical protein
VNHAAVIETVNSNPVVIETTDLAICRPSVLTAIWTGYVAAGVTGASAAPLLLNAELVATAAVLPIVAVPINLGPVVISVGADETYVPFTVSGAIPVAAGTTTVDFRMYNGETGATAAAFELAGTLTAVANRAPCTGASS